MLREESVAKLEAAASHHTALESELADFSHRHKSVESQRDNLEKRCAIYRPN